MNLAFLILLSAIAFPFIVRYGIEFVKMSRTNPHNWLKLCFGLVTSVVLVLLFSFVPKQINQMRLQKDKALIKSHSFLLNKEPVALGQSFNAQQLNQRLMKQTDKGNSNKIADNASASNRLGLGENTPLYESNSFTNRLHKMTGLYLNKRASYVEASNPLQKISLNKLSDAYYVQPSSTYFSHNHELIFTQNSYSDIHSDDDMDSGDADDDDGIQDENLNYIDPIEDGKKIQGVAYNSKYKAFSLKQISANIPLRKQHLADYDYQTLIKHEWHPVGYNEITYKRVQKLAPVVYYLKNDFAYYLPLTKFGNDFYYQIKLNQSLIASLNKRVSFDPHHKYYIKASSVKTINGHNLFVYNLPIEISAKIKQTWLDKLLLCPLNVSTETINQEFLQMNDPYNYRLNYGYLQNTHGSDQININKTDPENQPAVDIERAPALRFIDELPNKSRFRVNRNNMLNEMLAIRKINHLKQYGDFSSKDSSKNADNDYKRNQVRALKRALQEQETANNQQMPRYATATLNGEQPDIQHLLALSFGYTNLDPEPNDPWKRNEAGSEPYLKFDTLFSPTAKHNIQPKYPINKVVYVQSIVRNSIKGRHNEFYLLAQGDEKDGGMIRRWTYPIIPNKYVHVSDIIDHKQIKTHYNNFLDTSIFAYHMLDLDRYNHYDNAFRFIPDYTTLHNVYQTSGQPGSRTTNETIYDTFLPPIDTAEDNLKQEK